MRLAFPRLGHIVQLDLTAVGTDATWQPHSLAPCNILARLLCFRLRAPESQLDFGATERKLTFWTHSSPVV